MSRARELAKAGGVQQRIAGFSSHVGMSTFLAEVHMEDNLTVDGNIGVGGNLTVTGTTTFNGGTLNLGNAATDNVVFGGEVDSNIIPDDDNSFDLGSSSKEWKDLYVDGVAYLDSVESDGGSFGNINVGETGDNEIDTESGNLTLDSAGGTVAVDDNLTVSGNASVTGTFDVDGATTLDGLTVAEGASFSSTLDVDGATTLDGLTVAEGASFSSTLDVDGATTLDALTVAEGATFQSTVGVTGAATFNGNVDLGNATSDTITATGRFDSDLVPSTDNARDIGTSSLEWKDLFIDGTAHIDTLDVDENAAIIGTLDVNSSKLTVGTGNTDVIVRGDMRVTGIMSVGNGTVTIDETTIKTGTSNLHNVGIEVAGINVLGADTPIGDNATIFNNGNATFAGTITAADLDISGSIDIDGTTNLDAVDIDGAVDMASSLTLAGNADFNGNLDVDGTTNLDAVDIDGAVDMASTLTLAGNADFNGNLDVDGTTNLDAVDIDGAVDMASTLTLAGNADFNGNLDVDGTSNLDAVDIDGAVDMASSLTLAGNADFNGNLDVDGTTDLDTTNVVGTLTVTGAIAADNVTINGNTVSTSSGNLTIDSTGGTTTIADNAIISGNLTVNGTTTTINSTTVAIDDKNFQVATGAADDAAANGAGFTVDSGDGDKTFNFEATGDNWGASENLNLASGKVYKINNTSILSATTLGSSVVSSSLTSVGTLGSLAVTNNITVGGSVDGRDIAGDGSKLDGIESGATADQTAAEIRTLVESASDSNVFTDADHSKLNGIEASATADQTAAEIRALVESASDSNVFTDADHSKLNGIEASATADQTASEILTLIKTVDGAGSGLDADTLDGISSASFLRSDASDSMLGTLTIGDGTGQHELHLKKADNNVSDHLQFYNGTTRMGEIGCEDTTWLRINQETAKNIYTPRYIRADAGFFVDGTSKGINGSGNFIGGTIAGASDYSTLLRSNTSDTMSGTLTMAGNILPDANGTRELGASGTRWANIYSSDLDLSNQAKGANSVDGTWGSYLIEEGEDHLFLTNRRSGKKYRFVLEEV